ncbi:MAG TPA: CPBP family intramembrane glutamic endopeptidase [Gemmataceae bacterium]|nr:CPBP family intramembrane glutamic endopeptidase [Gemmataceae bacterium]
MILLTAIGLGVRLAFEAGPELGVSIRALALGIAVFGIVLASDVSLHGLFCLLFGTRYRRRHRELAAVFRDQRLSAILAGSLMAGVGEELVFRGLSESHVYLVGGALAFGVLHHVRRDLWPFTVWAVWQGLLFASVVYLTEMLAVTMVAHFLHDLAGFLIFRYVNTRMPIEAKG